MRAQVGQHTVTRTAGDTRADVRCVWRFLAIADEPTRSDLIFAFGSRNLGVAHTVARLFHLGVAPRVLVTGGAVRPGEPTEADVYLRLLDRDGVAAARVIVEPHATNTGENVALGMAAARAHHLDVRRATLVAFPTSLRRCQATFAHQFPEIATSTVPAFSDLDLFEASTAKARRVVLAELDRLVAYPECGFFAPQPIPDDVAAAAQRLRHLDPAFAPARA